MCNAPKVGEVEERTGYGGGCDFISYATLVLNLLEMKGLELEGVSRVDKYEFRPRTIYIIRNPYF